MRKRHEMDERIFIVPAFVTNGKGAQFLVQDSDGQWYYLNHAHTWQTCPPPFSEQLHADVEQRIGHPQEQA